MNKKIKNAWISISNLLLCVVLNGCASTSAIYNNVANQAQNEWNHMSESAMDTARLSFGEMIYNFAQSAKDIAPGVIAGSMGVGMVLLLIVRKERTWRKRITGFFIIGIPLLMFILSYGLAILVTTYQF